jgi:glycosyltransferase involved in cell wall biosynthesis
MMLKFCYGVIVLGENLRYLFKPYFKEKNIFVVPNGGNYIFPERQNKTVETRILFFSNLYASKGILDVLNASKLLRTRNVPFIMDWVGAGSGSFL